MPRPSQTEQQRARLLPIVTQAFSELGYRRTTTAELARRCEVQENILYRLWVDKKSMYLAAIELTFEGQQATWRRILEQGDGWREGGQGIWQRLLEYQAVHQGETGVYRILFDALGEADDHEIRRTLRKVYRGFHRLVKQHLTRAFEIQDSAATPLPVDSTAWALIGLATITNIMRELALLPAKQREQMYLAVGKHIMSVPT